MNEISKRINEMMDKLEINQSTLAKRLGIATSSVSNFCNGKTNPSNQTITLICHEFNISEEWLRTGKGKMEIDPDGELFNLIDKMMRGENEFAKSLFKAFAKLDENQWKVVQQIVEDVANNQKEDK